RRYKLYDNGKAYDTIKDVLEQNPLVVTKDPLPVRETLQAAMDQYPKKGRRIEYERVVGKQE
ncbi:MAG TPA: hypothetical protein VE890_13375, partial [Thermoguttaceae bacterium]|nr:hypothetical protein [Thermoguttaceae bacterium]